MLKRTAIIDIGSNSARLVIYEQTSRYGFYLVCEQKSKVRIGEGAYEKNGYLQPAGIRRAYLALKSFLETIDKYQAKNILCVATSALRDAPNAKLFTSWIKKELNLSIKVIDGKQEAYYGALAALNLLPLQESAVTIDIGGGSSDLALIRNGSIVDTYSLDLGTVRLKELFFDKQEKHSLVNKRARAYIQKELKGVPKYFQAPLAIGIGGSARTLSRAIMKQSKYPLDKLHGFRYNIDKYLPYLEEIPKSSAKNLKKFSLKKNRFDTIREGTLIFTEILSCLKTKDIVSSEVGVREGVFLSQLLKENDYKFPNKTNPSIRSILDRFKPQIKIEKKRKIKLKLGLELYAVFQNEIKDNKAYANELYWALSLSSIGKTLTIYKAHQHAYYIAMQELNYGFTHEQIILVSLLLRMHGKELLHKDMYDRYKSLLPDKQTLKWLSFIYTLTVLLHEASNCAKFDFVFQNKILTIVANKPLYLAKEKIKTLEKPVPFAIIIDDKSYLPKCKKLNI